MKKEELEAVVAKALEEHPEVFPGSPQITELLKKYGVRTCTDTILRNLDISSLQLNWIKSSSEKAFLENLSRGTFNKLYKKYKEEIKKRLGKIIEEELKYNQDVFPSGVQISSILKSKYGLGPSDALINRTIDLYLFKLKWINESEAELFFEGYMSYLLRDKKYKNAVNEKFRKLVEKASEESLHIYPTKSSIKLLLKKKYGTDFSEGALQALIWDLDVTPIKLKWVKLCSDEIFIRQFRKGVFTASDKKVMDAIYDRIIQIAKKLLNDNPNVFPSLKNIELLLKENYGIGIDNSFFSRRNINLVSFKLNFLENCEDKLFVSNLSNNSFTRANSECKKLVIKKLTRIIKQIIKDNPDIFPSLNSLAYLINKKFKTEMSPNPLKRLDIIDLQIGWFKSCSEQALLGNLSKGTFGSLNEECRQALNRRMYGVLLSNINHLDALLISRETIDSYLKKFPDLAFLLTATQEHKFTIDQRIVLDMHLWKETRSEDLHELIGERVEQLWGFRELFALMKDGRCIDADIISMFHESLPERIGNYISESAVIHSFVDNLRSGDFKAGKGKDVLLLSFMHWLTDKQSAEIMLRLNQSVGTDNSIYMTSPNGLEYAENLIASMNTFGFVPEKVGSLYLLPPGESDQDEQRKLLTKGKILQFRKMQDVEKVPEELQLFSKEKKKKGGIRPDPKANIISYNEKTLKNSLPLITMKDVGIVFTEEIPEVSKVEIEGDYAILTLKGGIMLGFNVEPEHPYSIEVEGRKIPKGIDNAILDVTNGKEGFEIRKGLKTKYKDFMKLIRGKREQISGVKKTKLKRK